MIDTAFNIYILLTILKEQFPNDPALDIFS